MLNLHVVNKYSYDHYRQTTIAKNDKFTSNTSRGTVKFRDSSSPVIPIWAAADAEFGPNCEAPLSNFFVRPDIGKGGGAGGGPVLLAGHTRPIWRDLLLSKREILKFTFLQTLKRNWSCYRLELRILSTH